MSKPYLDYNAVETGPSPTVSVIWMHGLGDHGSSFVPLVKEFDLSKCPPMRFIFPHAPERPITANMGYEMSAWFDIITGFDSPAREDAVGVRESQAYIEELIAHEKAAGIASDKIILAGFSQGCAMALHTGLRYPEKLGGIIGLSGYLPLLNTVDEERSDANRDIPIFLAHGTIDQVVPFHRAQDALKLLQALGYNVEWHPYQMMHTMSMPEINDISAWLTRVLA